MDTKQFFLAGALALSCQEKLENLHHLPPLPKIEIPSKEVEIKTLEPLVLESEKSKEECTIDLSNNFIPELLSLSRDADTYFTTPGILQNPFQRERFGIFSSFAHHQAPFEHYAKAVELRGKDEQPKIELKFVPYTTEKTVKNIAALEQQLQEADPGKVNPKIIEQRKAQLQTLQTQVQTIKDVQQILKWEEFYAGEVNGIYDHKTTAALMKYQQFHQQQLRYDQWLKIDGRINTATRELLNKDFEDYALSGIRRVLEERVFHADCDDGRYPYVIEQTELNKLVESATTQLNLNTIEGVQDFFSQQHDRATVYLDIPERYKTDSMRLEIDVEKWDSGHWEKIRNKTNLRLYVIEDGNRAELFNTKAVVGGWVKNKKTGKKKQYKTPEREFYLKHVTILPHWNPPEWAAAEEEVKDEEKLPGPFNAFGMLNTPLYYDNKPQNDPFRAWQDADNGYRIHLTPWPSSVEHGGSSHGCIRIHPNMSRFFYFIAEYTPHSRVLENHDGRSTLKFTNPKGSFIPFEPEHYIRVRTCSEKCD